MSACKLFPIDHNDVSFSFELYAQNPDIQAILVIVYFISVQLKPSMYLNIN